MKLPIIKPNNPPLNQYKHAIADTSHLPGLSWRDNMPKRISVREEKGYYSELHQKCRAGSRINEIGN
jgi:hypothetical protein